MTAELRLHYSDASTWAAQRLDALTTLFQSHPWTILDWPDPSSGPHFDMRVRFVGPASVGEAASPSTRYLVDVLSRQGTSETTLAAVRTALSAISPHVRDGMFPGLSMTIPEHRTLGFELFPCPSIRLDDTYVVPIDATESHIEALDLLQTLEYSFDLKIKFASIDRNGRYVGDCSEEYNSLLAALPQGWQQHPDEFRIQTRGAGPRRAWHLHRDDLRLAVVEHETGVEFLVGTIVVGMAVNLASSALYDLIKGRLRRWRETRHAATLKVPTFVEIERTRKSPDGRTVAAEGARIRDPVDDACLRRAVEQLLSAPSEPATAGYLSVKEAFDLYENGKHRRYGLLFAVNGGAFAVAKFLTGEPEIALGNLTLWQLSLAMAVFTVVMTWDIFAFGLKMRSYLPGAFGPQGMAVVLLLGTLLCTAWLFVGVLGELFSFT
jgi:hypothetical protein